MIYRISDYDNSKGASFIEASNDFDDFRSEPTFITPKGTGLTEEDSSGMAKDIPLTSKEALASALLATGAIQAEPRENAFAEEAYASGSYTPDRYDAYESYGNESRGISSWGAETMTYPGETYPSETYAEEPGPAYNTTSATGADDMVTGSTAVAAGAAAAVNNADAASRRRKNVMESAPDFENRPLTSFERPKGEAVSNTPVYSRAARRRGQAGSSTAGRRGIQADEYAESESASGKNARGKNGKGKKGAKGKNASYDDNGNQEPSKKKKKKKSHPFLVFICAILGLGLIGATAAFIMVYSIVGKADPIDPTEFYSLLSESTVIYDQNGKEIDMLYAADSNREYVTIEQIPDTLENAFIALEDKTFRTHHGFNYIRMVGAILESLRGGSEISGTSTITQQIARNLWIQDEMYTHSYRRKIVEAYYAVQIEKELTKDEILEAYLNTIYFGYGSYGVQKAAQNYFGKDVSQLTIAECAALAALPQAPDAYQLVKFVEGGSPTVYASTLLAQTSTGVFVANDLSKERRDVCLSLMKNQGYITDAEYEQARNTTLLSMLKPDFTSLDNTASYFGDYVVQEVINDLISIKGYDYNKAWTTVYQGGLEIYSTLDPQAQAVLDAEFANPGNYPDINPTYDENGDIVNSDGQVLLYDYRNFFNDDGSFVAPPGTIDRRADGSAVVHYGGALNIYETEVGNATDYSIEFKDYYIHDEDWQLYSISGGYLNVPMDYKSSAGDDGVVISAEFFQNEIYNQYFKFNEDGSVTIHPGIFTLNKRTVQPQAAMTIVENSTGHIKAMIGGRDATGRMIYNRAIQPRQPGSSIKPLGVYSAALQQSFEEAEEGYTHDFYDYGIDKQGDKFWGDYITASSIVLDEKCTVDGEEWPKNFSRSYSGKQTLRTALRDSINTCAVKIVMQVGYEYSAQNIKNFGITTLVDEGDVNDINPAALALGGMTKGVTTLEMASAYTTFPNNGVRYEPKAYTMVKDRNGNILLENTHEPHRVLDAGVAWIMTDMLHDAMVYSAESAWIDGVYVGGKTGTATGAADEYCDIWYDGFTMNYTASLWIGNDKLIPLDSYSFAATSMWGTIMRQIDGSYLGERAEMPDNVVYTNGEYYTDGTQTGLVNDASLTQRVKICKETGLLATEYCPETEELVFNKFSDKTGFDYDKDGDNSNSKDYAVPTKYCDKHDES
ncbi:MAG: transglycosylase domain-containing protein, partial [Firmicutes bacterium]|nr:transglycosylase domain-containing protein [Bacillota bacterium]